MSKYLNEGEFFESDLAARSKLREQQRRGRLYRLSRRSQRMIAQHPSLLDDGFQIESSRTRPELVGLNPLESYFDTMSPEELVDFANECIQKDRPMTIDWDTRLACFVP